ncbi:MAG: hypothetical protein IJZ19_02260 [Lentisphaeria bacterium]|nr:hypothetical protein [Lentisphaeria bacterium]
MENFSAHGVNTICLFPSNTVNSLGQPYSGYAPNRFWFGTYDFSAVEQQVQEALEKMPAARILMMIDLNSPEWLARQIGLAHTPGDSTTHLTETLLNPRWVEDTSAYVTAFLDFCESKWSDRIDAYIPACGNTDEWFDHNGESCSLIKEKAYGRYREEKGLPPEIPPSAGKLNSPDFDELVFDPATSSGVLEYRRFCNEVVADGLLMFAEKIKNHLARPVEVGAFFGYITDRAGVAESGHAFLRKVVRSPWVDFIISPGCYRDRAIGGGSGWQSISGTERLAGKRHFHECDQRTHTYNKNLSPYVKLEFQCWQNTTEDIAGIRREAALAIITRSSLWWFDMWGGFYTLPEQLECIRECHKLYDCFLAEPSVKIDEVALITDEDTAFYLDQRSPRQRDFQSHIRTQLNRLGAAYDHYLLEDLPEIENWERYKLIILSNQIEITPKKAELLKKYVYSGGKTVLVLYAPGISDGRTLDVKRVEKFAGVPYAAAGLNITQKENCQIAYLHDPALLTASMLRQLAEEAGALLNVSAEVPVYADSRLLAVHLPTAGTREIRLPHHAAGAVELFSGKKITKNVFNWHSESCETLLFELL